MSDSANTNELESYGVWVKKPPRTVDSSGSEQPDTEEFNLDAELPDLPDIDDSVNKSVEEKSPEPSFRTQRIRPQKFLPWIQSSLQP